MRLVDELEPTATEISAVRELFMLVIKGDHVAADWLASRIKLAYGELERKRLARKPWSPRQG